MKFQIGGDADPALIERALLKVNKHFDGADIESAIKFALAYLASLVVIHERYAGPIEIDDLVTQLEAAIEAGNEAPRQS